jgi:hypothetical protein
MRGASEKSTLLVPFTDMNIALCDIVALLYSGSDGGETHARKAMMLRVSDYVQRILERYGGTQPWAGHFLWARAHLGAVSLTRLCDVSGPI